MLKSTLEDVNTGPETLTVLVFYLFIISSILKIVFIYLNLKIFV